METLIWFTVPGAVLALAVIGTNPALVQSEASKFLAAVAIPAIGFCLHQFYRILFEAHGGFAQTSRLALNRIQREVAPESGIADCDRNKAFLIWETTFYGTQFPSAFREHDRGAWHYILSFRGTVFAAVLGLLWTAFWYFAQGRQPRLLAVAAAEVAIALAFAFKAKYSYKSLVRQEVAATFVWYELFVTTCEKLQKMA